MKSLFCLVFSQNTGSINGTPNYNKPLSYTGGYIGKYGLTFYFFSVQDYGFAYVVGGWNESKGGNTEWNTRIYRLTGQCCQAASRGLSWPCGW